MNTQENQKDNSLLGSQEPHQKEELDQASAASTPSFTLEPEKGIGPEPGAEEQGNVKQAGTSIAAQVQATAGGFDPVNELDLDAGENDVTADDLQALGGADENADEEESTMS
ncbi:hypothetical protein [Pedobacter sp. GR22-6]|uniref:hypothetical protein n=1 Tax=Pedobacter sp. GR22-6 TaxID=3127957 RepID=UPI00307E6CBA